MTWDTPGLDVVLHYQSGESRNYGDPQVTFQGSPEDVRSLINQYFGWNYAQDVPLHQIVVAADELVRGIQVVENVLGGRIEVAPPSDEDRILAEIERASNHQELAKIWTSNYATIASSAHKVSIEEAFSRRGEKLKREEN